MGPDGDGVVALDDVAGALRDVLTRLERIVLAARQRGDVLPLPLRGALDDALAAVLAADRAALAPAASTGDGLVPRQPAPPPAELAEDRLELPVSPASAPTARTFVRQALARWGVQGAPAAAAVDVASELVTNAVAHAWAVVTLQVEASDDAVVVRVSDDSPDQPRLLPYVPGRSERGLGLRIVQSLSTTWGHRPTDAGKEVWAVVARRPGREPAG